jgi:hypothetical protein
MPNRSTPPAGPAPRTGPRLASPSRAGGPALAHGPDLPRDPPPPTTTAFAWALVGALLLGACDSRLRQCNDLVERLNPHTEALVRGVEGLARVESEPATLDALVEAIDGADRQLAVIQLEDERLAGFGLRYRRQLMDAHTAADAMRRAAAAKDEVGLNAAAKQADAFLEAQAAILDELNQYCATR